jgi:hypothetical protein
MLENCLPEADLFEVGDLESLPRGDAGDLLFRLRTIDRALPIAWTFFIRKLIPFRSLALLA